MKTKIKRVHYCTLLASADLSHRRRYFLSTFAYFCANGCL